MSTLPPSPDAPRRAVRVVDREPERPPGRNRRAFLLAGVVLVIVAVGAVIFAAHTDPSSVAGSVNVASLPILAQAPPPAVKPVGGWLNGPAPTAADLQGKVVIYDFWTYSCINCVRTIPYLRSWYNRYSADGLVIVGVESPEFDFEKIRSNVEAADKKLGVVWPVALDNNMAVWNAFDTEYWPTKDIVDRQGRLRYQDIGEGEYTQTENVIRQLLGVAPTSPRAAPPSEVDSATGAGNITAESYLGTDEGQEGARSGTSTYPANPRPVPEQVELGGTWTGNTQEITGAAGAQIVLDYHAREVNLVLAPPGPPNGSSPPPGATADLKITLDGQPLPAADRTVDTKVAADGSTYVQVTSDDMYRLVLTPAIERHVLTLTVLTPGLEAFDFTFGG
jgi:thiol-disulfide isomerase/thioredoxin